MRHLIRRRIALTFLITSSLIVSTACGASTLSKLHDALNKTAKALNAAAKTNHNFYETGIYGAVGSEAAIRVRQQGATVIHGSNEKLILALNLAKGLTAETFQQGKLAVLQALGQAAAGLHTGNQSIDIVLQGIAALINQAVILIEAFRSSDLRFVLPRIQSWQIERITA